MSSSGRQRVNGEAILSLRLAKRLTQRQVADAVGIGMRTYRRYERSDFAESGHGSARLDSNNILSCIAQFFEIPVEKLLRTDTKPERAEYLSDSAVASTSSGTFRLPRVRHDDCTEIGLDPRCVPENWDQSANVEFDRVLFQELCSLQFVYTMRDLIVTGDVGVGKTFLASLLGHLAVRAGFDVLFQRADPTSFASRERWSNKSTDSLVAELAAVDLLILDDFALGPMDQEFGWVIGQVLAARHRKASTIVTTNRKIPEWFSMFHDSLVGRSVVDRLANNAYELSIKGNSYRSRLRPRLGEGIVAYEPPVAGGPASRRRIAM